LAVPGTSSIFSFGFHQQQPRLIDSSVETLRTLRDSPGAPGQKNACLQSDVISALGELERTLLIDGLPD
jgi:hypothetical protein